MDPYRSPERSPAAPSLAPRARPPRVGDVVQVLKDAKANAVGRVWFVEPEGGVYAVELLEDVVGLHFASELRRLEPPPLRRPTTARPRPATEESRATSCSDRRHRAAVSRAIPHYVGLLSERPLVACRHHPYALA